MSEGALGFHASHRPYGSKGLSVWFASRPDARRVAREAAAEISDRRLHPDGGNPR